MTQRIAIAEQLLISESPRPKGKDVSLLMLPRSLNGRYSPIQNGAHT